MLIECEYDLMQRLSGIETIRVYGTGKVGGIWSCWLSKHKVAVREYIVTEKHFDYYGRQRSFQ